MNEYDIKRLALVLAIQAEIEGMKAHDKHNMFNSTYTKEDFDKKASELRDLAYKHNEQL